MIRKIMTVVIAQALPAWDATPIIPPVAAKKNIT
jgi:hypothetical protein